MVVPALEISAVTQAPMFCPIIIGIALPKVREPVEDSACKMPTEADELCITAVTRAPQIMPNTGFENMVRTLEKLGSSAKGAIASFIVLILSISKAKPIKMVAISCFLPFLPKVRIRTANIARIGANTVGFKSCIKLFPPSIPVRERIQAVTVVPIFAPIITPVA